MTPPGREHGVLDLQGIRCIVEALIIGDFEDRRGVVQAIIDQTYPSEQKRLFVFTYCIWSEHHAASCRIMSVGIHI